jgi:hypothetical protein
MERNSTNFPNLVLNALKQYKLTESEYDKLFFYQQWALHYFKMDNTKGILFNHIMGSGKTKTALAIIDSAIESGYKIMFIAPASLQGNLHKEIIDYNLLMGRNLDKDIFKFVNRSHALVKNISKVDQEPEKIVLDIESIYKNISQIENTLVVIDESHLIMQSISNGSAGAVEFYDLIMNSPNIRVIMLTGTIINSRPFELAPMYNMLDGSRIFPEMENLFMEAFWDREKMEMRNRNKFQNRIMGLISRIDADALSLQLVDGKLEKVKSQNKNIFPEQFETQVLRVPMSGRQIGLYMVRREKEIKENSNRKSQAPGRINSQKFSGREKESSTYRVRTRQCSNYAPPPEIESLYTSETGYTQEQINEVMDKAKPEELESVKFAEIIKLFHKHANQKGIVYSQFTDIGGNGALARFLSCPERGYQQIQFDKDNKPTNLGPRTFALLNRGIDDLKNRYNEILKIYNNPSNDHGEELPYLLIGLTEVVGLELKCARFVIMMEPHFIYSLYLQLVARAVRYKSHLSLPPNEQNVQPYILLAIYPNNFDQKEYINSQIENKVGLTTSQLAKGLELTTDEYMYQLMLKNQATTTPFAEASYECSIECSFLKEFFPDRKCRMCAPNNMKLFTKAMKDQSPDKLLNYDIREIDPCQEYKTDEVNAIRITVGDSDYYYTSNAVSPSGYTIYYFNKDKDIYEELFPTSPAYQLVIQALTSTRSKK